MNNVESSCCCGHTRQLLAKRNEVTTPRKSATFEAKGLNFVRKTVLQTSAVFPFSGKPHAATARSYQQSVGVFPFDQILAVDSERASVKRYNPNEAMIGAPDVCMSCLLALRDASVQNLGEKESGGFSKRCNLLSQI